MCLTESVAFIIPPQRSHPHSWCLRNTEPASLSLSLFPSAALPSPQSVTPIDQHGCFTVHRLQPLYPPLIKTDYPVRLTSAFVAGAACEEVAGCRLESMWVSEALRWLFTKQLSHLDKWPFLPFKLSICVSTAQPWVLNFCSFSSILSEHFHWLQSNTSNGTENLERTTFNCCSIENMLSNLRQQHDLCASSRGQRQFSFIGS